MKYLRKFNEGEKVSDWLKSPIIKSKCQLLGLKEYTINDDGTVDVDGNVHISSKKALKKIPIKFGIVNCNFDCGSNKLTSLVGSPRKTYKTFHCDSNQLTNLEGGPKEVGGSYNCESNKLLISLKGGPEILGGTLYCHKCPIYYIYSKFVQYPNNNKSYKRYLDSLDYNYLRGTNIIKLRFEEALEEAGVMEMPEFIYGYKYI